MRNRLFSVLLGGLVALTLTAESARAASLTLGDSGWKAFFSDDIELGLVDVASDRANLTITSAPFTDAFDRGVGPTLEITFVQVRDAAVPFITVNTGSILNQTGTDFAGLTFSLTEATGGDPAIVRFDPDQTFPAANEPLAVDPFNAFTFNADHTELRVDGGIVPDGAAWLPRNGDADLVIFAAPAPSGIGTVFFFKAQPTAAPDPALHLPEPAAAAGLLTLAFAALARRRR